MISLFLSFLCLDLLFSHISCQNSPLMVVQVLHHGARGPLNTMFDPSWGNNIGQLTNVGMRQSYVLGQTLKSKYHDLLLPFDSSKMYIRATDVKRAIMAAQIQAYSIFQGEGQEITQDIMDLNTYNVSIDLQNKFAGQTDALPFGSQFAPVHVARGDSDYDLKIGSKTCPNQRIWRIENFKNNSIWNEALQVLHPTLEYVNKTFPQIPSLMERYKLTYWDIFFYLAETIIANFYAEKPMPMGFDYAKYGKDVVFLYQLKTFIEYYGTSKQIQLLSLNLLSEILDALEARTQNKSQLNFVIYSAHDLTLLGPLAAFGLVSAECLWNNHKSGNTLYPFCIFPGSISDLRFELYKLQGNKEFQVKFLYNNMEYNLCQNTNNSCSLSQIRSLFKKATGGLSFQDYITECGVQELEDSIFPNDIENEDDSFGNLVIILGLIDAILVIAIVIAYTNNEDLFFQLVRGKKARKLNKNRGSPTRSPIQSPTKDIKPKHKGIEIPLIKIHAPESGNSAVI